MACLTYASTPITINETTYDRNQLLDKVQHELDLIGKGLALKTAQNQNIDVSVKKKDRY
jgi:riboflavin synthase alpha subunit